MSKYLLAASAAALAFATPALAQKHGNGHGGGKEQEHGQSAKGHGQSGKAHGNAKVRVETHGGKGQAMAVKVRGDDHRQSMQAKHDNGHDRGKRHVEIDERRGGATFPRLAVKGKGLVNGCPPGLAMKDNGCMPPGQFKKVGEVLAASGRLPALAGPYSQWFRDNDRYYYRMGDGVVYQVNRSNNLIDALIPYGMQDYSYYPVGYTYPSLYNSYNVPTAYQGYYPQGADYLYRYGGNAIYAVDPQTQMISSIVSLLAGDLSVGQRLPSAYNVYNIPLAYRSQYYDTPDAWYRYNDGYIYKVDPTTQLISAVINALV